MPLTDEEAGRLLPPLVNTPENRRALIAAGAQGLSVAGGFRTLSAAGLLDREDIRDEVVRAGAHANNVAIGIVALVGANLYTDEVIRDQVIAACKGEHGGSVARGMRVLRSTLLLGRDNIRNEVIRAGEHAENVAFGIRVLLDDANLLDRDDIRSEVIRAGAYAYHAAQGITVLDQAGLLGEEDIRREVIAAGSNAREVAINIINRRRADAVREPIRHIPLDAIPRQEAENERQRILDELDVDTSEERFDSRLIDPVTLAAIEHPRKLKGDATGQFFEYHSLMALNRNRNGDFKHPSTRIEYTDDKILDVSDEYTNEFNQTMLFYAIEKKNKNIVEQLIQLGADVNKPNSKGVMPLHEAAKQGDVGVVEVLLKAGAISGDLEPPRSPPSLR